MPSAEKGLIMSAVTRNRAQMAPLEHLLCPVALADITKESLSALGARRDELLGFAEE